MVKKLNKTQTAALETESNEMIQQMAIEALSSEDISAIDVLEAVEGAQSEAITEVVLNEANVEHAADEVTVEDTPAEETLSWNEALNQVDDASVDLGVFAVAKAIDDRAAYESVHGHPNIQKTLTSARKYMVTKRSTRVMIAAGFDEKDINREVHEGKRYNVYALGKLGDLINALAGGAITNAINNACMRSLFKFRKAGTPFTLDMAKAAASDKIRIDNAIKGLLVRHTVSASTAPTQASSTMQAAVSLGIVSSSGGKNPVFTVLDTPQAKRMEELLTAEAA